MLLGVLKVVHNSTLRNSKLQITAKEFHSHRQLLAKVAFNLSDIGEGIREVQVKEWYVKEGDKVSQFDNICEVQSDKASVTITSRYDGVIKTLHYKVDDIALVGKPLVDIETGSDEEITIETHTDSQISQTIEEIAVPETTKQDNLEVLKNVSDVDILCIPSVRRMAKEHNINLSNVKGTGKNGRILKEDLLKYLDKPQPVDSPSEPNLNKVPITGFKKVMVSTMTKSLTIPHFVYSDEIKVTKLSELRKLIQSSTETNIKLSFMPFFIKAVSNSLQKYPILNSSVDEACENIIFHKSHNIGVAMDTATGLAVPVIKNVQNLDIITIANELKRLLKAGKEGKFSPSDLSGGTFTVSNIGSIGGTYTAPIILSPHVGILGIGASQILPRFDEVKNVIAEEIVNVSASGDHRVIDGATMARFIKVVKQQLESPHLLLLNII